METIYIFLLKNLKCKPIVKSIILDGSESCFIKKSLIDHKFGVLENKLRFFKSTIDTYLENSIVTLLICFYDFYLYNSLEYLPNETIVKLFDYILNKKMRDDNFYSELDSGLNLILINKKLEELLFFHFLALGAKIIRIGTENVVEKINFLQQNEFTLSLIRSRDHLDDYVDLIIKNAVIYDQLDVFTYFERPEEDYSFANMEKSIKCNGSEIFIYIFKSFPFLMNTYIKYLYNLSIKHKNKKCSLFIKNKNK